MYGSDERAETDCLRRITLDLGLGARKGRKNLEMGALPPNPRDLTRSCRPRLVFFIALDLRKLRMGTPSSAWSGPGVGARVASPHCPTLRSGPFSLPGIRCKKRGRLHKRLDASNVAEGSLEECRYYLILAHDLGYGDTAQLSTLIEEVSKMLNAYTAAILSSGS